MTTIEPLTDLTAVGGNDEWTKRYGDALMGTFGTPKRVLVRGEGVRPRLLRETRGRLFRHR